MAYGDSFQDEDGAILYVGMTHGYNFKISPVGEDAKEYEVVFLNGGFVDGEPFPVGKAKTVNSACRLADKFDVRLP